MLQGFCSLACQIAAITYTHTRTHTRAWLGADGSMCAPPVHSLYAWAWEWPGGLPPLAKAGGPGCLMAQHPWQEWLFPASSQSGESASKGLPGSLSPFLPSSFCTFTASFSCLWSFFPSLFLQVELVELYSPLKAQCWCYLFQDAISDSGIAPLITHWVVLSVLVWHHVLVLLAGDGIVSWAICCCLVAKPCLTFLRPMDCTTHQASLFMGFPRQE